MEVRQVSARINEENLPQQSCWSTDKIRKEQEADWTLKPIREGAAKSHRPKWEVIAPYGKVTKTLWTQWDSVRERNGVLHRYWESNNGKETTLQLIVQEAMWPKVLLQLHSTRTAGHFGVNKTLKRLQQHFYWPGCRDEVRKFCKECDLCSSRKGPRRKTKAPMQIYRVGLPMERIAIDALGPLPESNRIEETSIS